MKKLPHSLLVAAALLVAHSLHADLVVYEGFDYEAGQLRDKAGGIGWAGAWRDAHQRVEAGESLASAIGDTPAATGGHMITPNGDWPAKRELEVPFAAEPGVYWISLLAVNLSGTREETYAHLRFMPKDSESKAQVGLSKDFNSGSWSLHAGGTTRGTPVPAEENPVFAVIRVTVGEEPGTSSAAIFMDPDLGTEPITPDVDISGIDLGPIEEVMVRCGSGEKLFGFDEIRLGTSFTSVAPQE